MGITAAIVAAGATTYSAVEASEDAHHAEQVAKKQAKDAVLARQRELDAAASEPVTAGRNLLRDRLKSGGGTGRGGTILTSPLGLPGGGAGYQPKTLLGT